MLLNDTETMQILLFDKADVMLMLMHEFLNAEYAYIIQI